MSDARFLDSLGEYRMMEGKLDMGVRCYKLRLPVAICVPKQLSCYSMQKFTCQQHIDHAGTIDLHNGQPECKPFVGYGS